MISTIDCFLFPNYFLFNVQEKVPCLSFLSLVRPHISLLFLCGGLTERKVFIFHSIDGQALRPYSGHHLIECLKMKKDKERKGILC